MQNIFASFDSHFRPLDAMLDAVKNDKGKIEYVQPALRNLSSVAVVLLRETIAPTVFRNEEQEITDVEAGGVRRVRAVANKFKFGERARGLQILRYFDVGGRQAQNRTTLDPKRPVSEGYDINTYLFGDSANRGNAVLPVKACALYSDALSLSQYESCVDETFHNRASEDGSLFDAEKKKNSVNIFSRHFVKPGVPLLQTVVFNGRMTPKEVFDHFLLCIGLAGAYGGQTSIYGINVRTRIVGVYGGLVEQAVASPYVALEKVGEVPGVDEAASKLHALYSSAYGTSVAGADVESYKADLVRRLEDRDETLVAQYKEAQEKVGAFFDGWFGSGEGN